MNIKLSPQKQALLEIVLLLLGAVGASLILIFIIENGWFIYTGVAMIAYGFWGLLKFYYENRVSVLQEEEKRLDK
jgi:membrane protein YdbS with pleckstrin-like domain